MDTHLLTHGDGNTINLVESRLRLDRALPKNRTGRSEERPVERFETLLFLSHPHIMGTVSRVGSADNSFTQFVHE